MIRPATLQEVIALPNALQATREHVSLTPTAGECHWFILEDEAGWIGFGAWMPMRTAARIKGIYVRTDRRGEGHGAAISLHLVEEARLSGYDRMDQFAASPAWWIAQGWTAASAPRPNGVQHLRLAP